MEESSGGSNRKATRSRKFTLKQKAIFSARFDAGMRGVGNLYVSCIDSVAGETGLQVDQMKVVHGGWLICTVKRLVIHTELDQEVY